jgi:hypothetical protein
VSGKKKLAIKPFIIGGKASFSLDRLNILHIPDKSGFSTVPIHSSSEHPRQKAGKLS